MDDRRRAFRYRRPSSWAAGRPPPGNCLSAGRAVLAAGAVVIGAAMAMVATSGPAYGRRRRGARAVHHASRMVLRTLGVRIELTGAPPVGASLVVANHVCWLDALVLAAAAPMVPVAGAEVDGWPVIGVLARRIGTVFVRQGEPRALPVDIENMTATLRAGHRVQVFPEGATWGAGALGKFRRAAFQAAVDAAVVVSPVALGYRDANGRPTTVGAFAGAGNRAASVRAVLGHRPAVGAPSAEDHLGRLHQEVDRFVGQRYRAGGYVDDGLASRAHQVMQGACPSGSLRVIRSPTLTARSRPSYPWTLHPADSDFVQAGDLCRLIDDSARTRLASPGVPVFRCAGVPVCKGDILERSVANFAAVDPEYGAKWRPRSTGCGERIVGTPRARECDRQFLTRRREVSRSCRTARPARRPPRNTCSSPGRGSS